MHCLVVVLTVDGGGRRIICPVFSIERSIPNTDCCWNDELCAFHHVLVICILTYNQITRTVVYSPSVSLMAAEEPNHQG